MVRMSGMVYNKVKNSNMADIAKCMGKDCKVKKSCYRFTAPPSEYWQSYIMPQVKDGKCDMYWETKSKRNESNIRI